MEVSASHTASTSTTTTTTATATGTIIGCLGDEADLRTVHPNALDALTCLVLLVLDLKYLLGSV